MKKRRLNYKSTIYAYIMIVSFIPILVLGAVSYRTFIDAISDRIAVQTESTISQVKDRVDTALYNIRSYYINELDEDELEWLINTDIWYSDYSKLYKATNIMAGPSYYLTYISGYTFINFNTQWVLSNRGMFRYVKVTNQKEIGELFHTYDGTLTRTFWKDNTKMAEVSLPREEIKINGLNLVFKAPLINKKPNCLMIINIDQTNLRKILREDLADGDITVFDKDGGIVYTTNNAVAAYCRQNFSDLKQIKKFRLSNGREYSIAAANSGVLDWTYMVSHDMGKMNSGGEVILTLTVILIVLIAVVLGAAVLSTQRIYKPIGLLTKRVDDLAEPMENGTVPHSREGRGYEFEYIAKSIDHLVDNRNFFEKLLAGQRPNLVELFQIRLMRGDIRKEHLDNYLDNYKIQKVKYYLLINGILKSGPNQEFYDETKQDALRISVIENMPEHIKGLLFLPPLRYERTLVLTVAAEDLQELDKKGEAICNMLNAYISEAYGVHINAGVSLIHSDLMEFRIAYQEALEAMKSNEFLRSQDPSFDNNVLLFYSDIKIKRSHYTYDRLAERELKEAIDSGDAAAAFKLVDHFIDAMVENDAIQSDYYLHLHRIVIAAMLVATDAGITLDHVFDKDMENNIFLKMDQIYDIEKMRHFIKNKVIKPVITIVSDSRTSKSTDTMKDIERLVEETSGNITLAECAERLHYHPSYIWKITKMKINMTFTDYVGSYKIEKAKELLLNTDRNISDIAAALNYTNAQNFIRFFSKMEGITPGKFRSMNKVRGERTDP